MLRDEFHNYSSATRTIAHILEASDQIVLTTHARPDGDGIGSLLALRNALIELGKSPYCVVVSPVPSNLRFLPGSGAIEHYDPRLHETLIARSDAIVCLDFNRLSRIEAMGELVRSALGRRILIDHHLDPEDCFDAVLHDVDIASTAELVFVLIALEFPSILTHDVAVPIYTGIVTDTGSFRFPRVTPRTHRIVAALIEAGVQPSLVHEAIYDTNTIARLRLLGDLLQNIEIGCAGRCALMTLSRHQLLRSGVTLEDTEGFVNYTLSISGVKVGIFLSQLLDQEAVKVSLRSKGNADVRKIAEQLGGGGHLNAAGAVVRGMSLDNVRQHILNLAAELLETTPPLQQL
ncbi:MAG: bifunctional oligoribonuclease/PAP phosphatase NrnA [Chlorobi bacterium]|nr:bifunctional oligoribonuclease/PAP phosphatase NrnA [Chlorobiota bacterium]